MEILVISDIHNRLGNISAIADDLAGADVVLIAGDITNFGSAKQAKKIVTKISNYNSNILAVPGNCDPPSVEAYLSGHGMSLHCNRVELDGIKFVGLGGAIAGPGFGLAEFGDDDFSIRLNALEATLKPDDISILVTHQPAFGTRIDDSGDGHHAGSKAVRDFIDRNHPIVAVSGHIHNAFGTEILGSTTLINPGPISHRTYGYIKIGETVSAEIRTIK
ncbi:MAG: metallophosphoesterase family protein [Planctomycetes bacterium]|nr:metallophosphoesterase family protein [Planctomycetota bacterium]